MTKATAFIEHIKAHLMGDEIVWCRRCKQPAPNTDTKFAQHIMECYGDTTTQHINCGFCGQRYEDIVAEGSEE